MMNYIQYMQEGGNFWQNLGDAIRYAHTINNMGGSAGYVIDQSVEDLRKQGKEKEAQELLDQEMAGRTASIMLGVGGPKLISGFKLAPFTTGLSLAGGLTGGIGGTMFLNKGINWLSNGKYVDFGNWVKDKTKGLIGQQTGNMLNPAGWVAGIYGAKGLNKVSGLIPKGRVEQIQHAFHSAFNENIDNAVLPKTISESVPMVSEITPVSHKGKNSLAFYERNIPKRTLGEQRGIPKGQERFIVDHENQILANAKAFAEKYGYNIPKTIDEVKDMYRIHNRWFRSVYVDGYTDDGPYVGTSFDLRAFAPELSGLSADEIAMKFASRGYPAMSRTGDPADIGQYLDKTVFAAPNAAENISSYGSSEGVRSVMLQRPFSFRSPLTWHIDADYRPVSRYYPHLLTKGQVQIGNAGPVHEIKLATEHLIPVKMAEPTDKGTLLGEYLGGVTYKSGGKLNYLNYSE